MQVIDNFLPIHVFENIRNTMLSRSFPWFYSYGVVRKHELICDEKYNYQFGHHFHVNHSFCGDHYKLVVPILDKLNPICIYRIKALLLPRTEKNIEHGYHIDNNFNTKAAIFYVNTNDGYTKFSNGKKVNSLENRIVIFDGDIEHTGATCTDKDVRVAINFNYY